MERKLYKASLSVNSQQPWDFEKLWVNIKDAADEFTACSWGKKHLTIVKVDRDCMHIAVAFNVKKGYEKFNLRHIFEFLMKLHAIFNIDNEFQKGLFSINDSIRIDKNEFDNLIKEAENNHKLFLIKNKKLPAENELPKNNSLCLDCIDEQEHFIPKRQFPSLLSGGGKSPQPDKGEDFEFNSYRQAMLTLESMVGMDKVKKTVKEMTEFIIRNNDRYVKLNIQNPGLYYNVAVYGNKGTGKDAVARIIYSIFYHLGVIGKGKLINVNSRSIYPETTLDRYLANAQNGIVLFNDAHAFPLNEKRGAKDMPTTLDEWLTKYKDNFVFIFAGETQGVKDLLKDCRVKKHINFEIEIPDFNEREMFELVKYFAAREKYRVANGIKEIIKKRISYEKFINNFENALTARLIVEQAIIKKALKDEDNLLRKENFSFSCIEAVETSETKSSKVDREPFEELEGMVGLELVKKRVKEICSYVSVQLRRKNMGMEIEPITLHMEFTGNPGTGKSTVAKIIGKILYNIGVLSSGNFVEASRGDLVGEYIGHTAARTQAKIKEAEGGVLFIDEAYSLYNESKRDYGYEAVATLIKNMEDKRDKFIVIFAGYPKEMEEFINMNPGLRDRIQFKIDFPDYSGEDLLSIFEKFCKDEHYTVEENGISEMRHIIDKLISNNEDNFANGRIIRKCFERIKLYLSMRILENNIDGYYEMVTIKREDICCLYDDPDIKDRLQNKLNKRSIGFSL